MCSRVKSLKREKQKDGTYKKACMGVPSEGVKGDHNKTQWSCDSETSETIFILRDRRREQVKKRGL